MSIGARYQATLAQTTGLRDLESARERGNATILDQEGVAWVRICRSILALRSEAEQQQLVDRDLAARAAVLREWLASFLGPDGMLERFCASWRTAFAFEAVQWVMTQHAAAVQAVAVIAQCEAQVAARIAVARLEGADRQIMERGETKELTAIAAAFEHHRQLQSIKESEQRLRETVILAERGHWASLARSIVQFEMRSKLEDEVMRERCLTRREFCIGVVALAEAHHGVCVAHAELTMRSRLCAEFLLDLASATRRAMGTAQEAGQRWIAQQCVTHADEWKGRSAIVTEEKVSRRNTVAVICGIVEAQSRVVLETLYHARCKAFELENAAEVALLDVARMELQSRNHLYMLANRGCCVALEFDEKRGRERLASAWRRQLDGTARLYVTSERMVEYARCDECERGARRRVAALATADLDALRVQQLTTAETEERGRIVAVEVAARTFEARVNAMTECAHDQKRRLAIRGASEIAVVAAACTALAACCAEEETRRRRLIDDARRDAATASILVQHRFAFDAIARDEGHERERLRSIVPPFSVLSAQELQRRELMIAGQVEMRRCVADLQDRRAQLFVSFELQVRTSLEQTACRALGQLVAHVGRASALLFDEAQGRAQLASAWRRLLNGTARLYVTSERMVEYARCDECERGARRRVAALATADLDALRVQQLTTAETEERGRIVAVEVAARTFEARVNAMTECAHDQKRRLAIRGASEIAVVAAACTALAACCAEEETRRRRLIDDARRDAATASILVQHRFAFDAIARDEGHERERLRSIVPPFSVLSTHAREQARQRNQLAVVSEVALRLSVAELYENFVLELQSCESAIRQHVQDQAFHRVAEQGTAALRDLRLALASAREERDSTCHRGDRPEVNCQEMSPAPMSGDASRSPFPIVPTTHSSLLAFYTGGRDAHTVCPDPVSPQHEESHPAAAGPSDPIPMLLYRAIHDGSKAGARPLDASKRPATEIERGPTNVNDYGAVMSQNRATRNRQSGATEKSVSCVSFLFDYIGAMVANLRRKFSSAAI